MIRIRPEKYEDIDFINSIIISAFRGHDEARLVNLLREEDALTLSLVAENDGEIVGHIAFSPMEVEFNMMNKSYLGLAPLAVKPAFQKQKVGSRLVRSGLEQALSMGWYGVFVLGDPQYYSRFGFRNAVDLGFFCEYEAPPENFMAVALRPGGLEGSGGLAKYHSVFKELGN
jgi:putative acetyltransferase